MKLLSRRVFLSYDYSPTDRFPIWPRRLYRTELPGILFCNKNDPAMIRMDAHTPTGPPGGGIVLPRWCCRTGGVMFVRK